MRGLRRLGAGLAGLTLCLAPPAQADGRARGAAPVTPRHTVVLPGAAQLRAAAGGGVAAGWVLGVTPGPDAARALRAAGARPLGVPTAWRVATPRARGVAARLRAVGALRYAHADHTRVRAASFDGQTDRWARAAVVAPLTVPPVGTGPVGVVDDFVDATHPDLAGRVAYANATDASVVGGPHGTEVASAIIGAANGTGVTGVLPAGRVVSWGVPDVFGCAESSEAIARLSEAGVKVINASYGSPSPCVSEYEAIQLAYARGSVVVAAAGNDYEEGNPIFYPAAFPHVLSVAADRIDGRSAPFSNANTGVDVSAPGVEVPLAIPPAFDDDGSADGVTVADGTSFASPIAAAAVAWVRAARPGLDIGQVVDAIRGSATDLEDPGYDTDTGFGRVAIDGALALPAPPRDPLEPNDSISAVDGSIFGRPDPSVWNGTGVRTLKASVDDVKDPVDVFRLRIPGRATFAILLRPGAPRADVELYAFDRSARDLSADPVASSTRGAGRTETVRLVNGSPVARTAYVVVRMADASPLINARYTLVLRRRARG